MHGSIARAQRTARRRTYDLPAACVPMHAKGAVLCVPRAQTPFRSGLYALFRNAMWDFPYGIYPMKIQILEPPSCESGFRIFFQKFIFRKVVNSTREFKGGLSTTHQGYKNKNMARL
jgi:hypothetical protein